MSNKNLHKKDMLNRVMALLPEGVVAPMAWFTEQGYSRQLVNQYAKRGWLKNLGHGIYSKPGSEIGWQGVVLGLQMLLNLNCHVGGISALHCHGLTHYLKLSGEEKIYLFGDSLPTWVSKLSPNIFINKKKLFSEEPSQKIGIIGLNTNIRELSVKVSTPERSILEVISFIQSIEEDFIAASELMEGLHSLRPGLMQNLLESCKDIKTKRVCLFLANHMEMPWVNMLDIEKINLGVGKRQIVKGGRFNKEFQITVPNDFK